jgi:hypothetical protein
MTAGEGNGSGVGQRRKLGQYVKHWGVSVRNTSIVALGEGDRLRWNYREINLVKILNPKLSKIAWIQVKLSPKNGTA